MIRLDNAPELVSQVLQAYCDQRIGLQYIPPGQPWRNGYAELFNNRCRDECLNLYEFDDLIEAKIALTDWKTGYNKSRLHSRPKDPTPNEYAAQCTCSHRPSE